LQAQTPAKERRREGATLYVQCPYTAKTNNGWKAWCILKNGLACWYSYVRQSTDEKVTIDDNPTAGTVSVTMKDLKAEDSGTYMCLQNDNSLLKTISLNVFKGQAPTTLSDTEGTSQANPSENSPAPSSNVTTFILLSVILSILLTLALLTSVALCVRLHKLLQRTGSRGAEDTYGNSQGTAQLGSTGRRESSKDDSRGLKYINQDLQSQPSLGDPLYSNIEPNHRSPRGENVEYAVIAFNQAPR
ncbi:PIGR protein, partial [Serilophus lunatus]|nr:PIGR protein [Serilophus lunatus]